MVFEYCDQDLKKYFDTCRGRIDKKTVQVSIMFGWFMDFVATVM